MGESSTLPDRSITPDKGRYDFEAIKERAFIPPLPDAAGKVLDVLQMRIGHATLNIEEVATDMNLSKRTLQRRLQQQLISFAALRDLVRFNHAIDCLLNKGMSIESTSSYLDFADRTSFTNAFKRWVNMSPSAFRKQYKG